MRQTDHISCVTTYTYAKKITLHWHWSMEEAQICSAAALLHLALGVSSPVAFWSQMCSPVSENLVFVAGHRFTNTAKNTQDLAWIKSLDFYEVSLYVPDLNPLDGM